MKRTEIAALYAAPEQFTAAPVTVCGWIRTNRDSKALGFISRLCAGKVPTVATGAADDNALEKFAAAVNEIPAITHNYVRSHEYNVWFTVIAQSEAEIQKIVDDICAKTELHDVHVLSATKKFKINTVMGAGSDERRKWCHSERAQRVEESNAEAISCPLFISK